MHFAVDSTIRSLLILSGMERTVHTLTLSTRLMCNVREDLYSAAPGKQSAKRVCIQSLWIASWWYGYWVSWEIAGSIRLYQVSAQTIYTANLYRAFWLNLIYGAYQYVTQLEYSAMIRRIFTKRLLEKNRIYARDYNLSARATKCTTMYNVLYMYKLRICIQYACLIL